MSPKNGGNGGRLASMRETNGNGGNGAGAADGRVSAIGENQRQIQKALEDLEEEVEALTEVASWLAFHHMILLESADLEKGSDGLVQDVSEPLKRAGGDADGLRRKQHEARGVYE